jgi:two-component system cell cycle sensor histidine kinase/response regulator CckA
MGEEVTRQPNTGVSRKEVFGRDATGTILLVEDEESVRELVRTTLERKGYTVLDTGQGDVALEMAASHAGRIDILISDLMLPGISGRELGLKVSESHPETKILFVSGYPEETVARPGVAFLQKPFTLQALAGKVQDVLAS